MIRVLLTILFLLYTNPCFAGVFCDASNDIITCGTANTFLTENGALSICGWLRPDGDGEGAGSGRIIGKETATGTGVRFTTESSGGLRFQVSGSTSMDVNCASAVTFGADSFVCLTWDGTCEADNVHVYVNNSEVTCSTRTDCATPTDNSSSTISLCNRGNTDRTYEGVIYGNFCAWNSVISSTSLTNLYNSGKQGYPCNRESKDNLLMWLELNECRGSETCSGASLYVDDSGNSNNCTPTNNPVGFNDKYTNLQGMTLQASTWQ
jgi:hypothetical protein